jgi:hypothetical protein
MFFESVRNKLVIAVSCLAIFAVMAPSATAQRFDRGTTVTFNEPFEIPGKTLPAGNYVFRLMDIAGSRNVVQILNADETKSHAIVLAISDYRLEAPEKTAITFYEAERGAPLPLRAWFYPAYNYGVEFVYPKKKAVEIAKVSGEHVIATTTPESSKEPSPGELKTEPLIAIQPGGAEVGIATVHPEPATPRVTEARPAPTEPVLTAQAEAPKEVVNKLPKTATPFPLVSLTGLFAAGAAGALRVVRRRKS